MHEAEQCASREYFNLWLELFHLTFSLPNKLYVFVTKNVIP